MKKTLKKNIALALAAIMAFPPAIPAEEYSWNGTTEGVLSGGSGEDLLTAGEENSGGQEEQALSSEGNSGQEVSL